MGAGVRKFNCRPFGLLAPKKMERILREQLRADRIERMKVSRASLADEPLPAMTPEEINAEIEAGIDVLHVPCKGGAPAASAWGRLVAIQRPP